MHLKNSGDSTGFEPVTSAMPVQCSNQLSYEVTQLKAGQFVGLMFSRERNVRTSYNTSFIQYVYYFLLIINSLYKKNFDFFGPFLLVPKKR